MNEKGKYLYCVIKEAASEKFDILGQEGSGVYTINEGDLAMAVSDSEVKEYSFIKEHLTTHQKVIEEVMKKGYDVLPVRFGTVAKSIEDVKGKILKSKRKEFLNTFKTVEGMTELGLRALWKNMPNIFQEIAAESKEIQKARKEAQKNPNQFKVAAVGELVAKALKQKIEKEAEETLAPLKKLAAESKERQLMGDSMIFSSAFLVPKKNEKKFDKRVETLIKEQGERTKFIYVGPIPPFNFVELHLKV